jgi:HD-GYP domain-containing protein (c-di-GMP phosphodiesterase class II)
MEPQESSAPGPGVELADAQLRMSDLISALSFALDLTEGQPMGHSIKTCILAMRMAEILGLSVEQRSDIYYATLVKDAGCSSNAARMFEIFGGDERRAKREVKTQDSSQVTIEGLEYLMRNVMPGRSRLERVVALANIAINRKKVTSELFQLRCERGEHIAMRIGLSKATQQAIYSLDEHWDGNGFPHGLAGQEIPLLSRIINVCQTLEVFVALNGPHDAYHVMRERSGIWFDPEMVQACMQMENEESLWQALEAESFRETVMQSEPVGVFLYADEGRVDSVCEAFAEVIDIKSPFTHTHSSRVSAIAVRIAKALGMAEKDVKLIERASLLHDIGKLSVPNSVLDKPGKLTAQEWETMRLHPYYTQRILERVEGFKHLAFIASTHHEKLDGTGYYRNLRATQLPLSSRAITVADIFEAMSAKRPYRDPMPMEKIFKIMGDMSPKQIDEDCFQALTKMTDL